MVNLGQGERCIYIVETKEVSSVLDAYIRQYGRRLYGLCLTLCGSVQEAEDLYQDTWLKALRYFSRYDPQLPFAPWLTKICVNTYRKPTSAAGQKPVSHLFHRRGAGGCAFLRPGAGTGELCRAPCRHQSLAGAASDDGDSLLFPGNGRGRDGKGAGRSARYREIPPQ